MPAPAKLKQKARKKEQVGFVCRMTIVFLLIIIGIVVHAWIHEDEMKERTRASEFERKVNRKAIHGPRPKDKPLGQQAVKTVRSYLHAFKAWFDESEYQEEWIEQIKMFENAPLYTGTTGASTVHQDRLRPGVREVGYGITDAEIYEAKRFGILSSDATLPTRMSKEEADQWFKDVTIPTYEKCVEEIVDIPLTCEQKFALISFCHNLGKGNLAKLTMQDGRLKDSNYANIANCMLLYTNAGANKNVTGLVRRRQWEAGLWQSGTHNYSEEVAAR